MKLSNAQRKALERAVYGYYSIISDGEARINTLISLERMGYLVYLPCSYEYLQATGSTINFFATTPSGRAALEEK